MGFPLMRLALALLLIALPATAQVRGVASLGIGDNSGLGYASPSFSAGMGVEYDAPHLRTEVSADYSPNRKDSESSGYSYGGGANVYAALGAFLVGGGAHWSRTTAPEWSKDSWRPVVAVGVELPVRGVGPARILVEHVFSGSDRSNDLDGERLSARLQYRKQRLSAWGGLWRFHASGGATEYVRTTYGLTYSSVW